MPLLTIAVQGKSTSFRMDGSINTGETKVDRLYKTLFSSRSCATPNAAAGAHGRAAKSVIDYLLPELSELRGAPGHRRSAEDRRAPGFDPAGRDELDGDGAACGVGARPVDPGAPTEYQASLKAFSDLVAMALRCDVTRSVAITWADDGGSGPYAMPFLMLNGGGAGGLGEVHAIAHQGAAGYPKKINHRHVVHAAARVPRGLLDATADEGGTILDNSLIVMANDMTEGSFHSVSSIPIVLVGSAGGAFTAGRTVRVGSWAKAVGNYWSS